VVLSGARRSTSPRRVDSLPATSSDMRE
jgi:hypothetical protein